MKPNLKTWGLRPSGNVILIVGSPNSGKTVLAYSLADLLHGDRSIYVPMSERFDRPEYYKRLSWPYSDNSVIMHTDASLSYHARRYMSGPNIQLDMIQDIRRHRNTDFIWDVQKARSVDVNVVADADALILKDPSLLQIEFERRQIQNRYEIANRKMGGDVDEEDLLLIGPGWKQQTAYVYVHKRHFKLYDIRLPSYWNENISTDDIQRETTTTKTLKWIDTEIGEILR